MLPHAYQLPAAILLLLAGALTCFAGYRLFRIVLVVWGFILGAFITSSMMGVGSAMAMLTAGLVGGLVGALALVFMYFMGVALLGAALGTLVTVVLWSQLAAADPPGAVVVIASIAGAIGAMLVQRHVVIVGTAFFGAWMVIVGVLAIAESTAVRAVRATNDVWILYPLSVSRNRWAVGGWIVVGLIGMVVQLGVTGKKN